MMNNYAFIDLQNLYFSKKWNKKKIAIPSGTSTIDKLSSLVLWFIQKNIICKSF